MLVSHFASAHHAPPLSRHFTPRFRVLHCVSVFLAVHNTGSMLAHARSLLRTTINVRILLSCILRSAFFVYSRRFVVSPLGHCSANTADRAPHHYRAVVQLDAPFAGCRGFAAARFKHHTAGFCRSMVQRNTCHFFRLFPGFAHIFK